MLSDVIGQQLQHHRRRLGLSRTDVAVRCAELGWPSLTEPVVGYIETGRPDAAGRRRREVTIDELVILSRALSVAPLELVTGAGARTEVEILPGLFVTPGRALAWLSGRAPLPGQDWSAQPSGLGLAASHEREEELLREAIGRLRDPADADGLLQVYAAFRVLWWVRSNMEGQGMVAPKLSPDLAWVDRVEWSPAALHALSSMEEPNELPQGFRPGGPLAWEVDGDAPIVE